MGCFASREEQPEPPDPEPNPDPNPNQNPNPNPPAPAPAPAAPAPAAPAPAPAPAADDPIVKQLIGSGGSGGEPMDPKTFNDIVEGIPGLKRIVADMSEDDRKKFEDYIQSQRNARHR